MLDVTEVTDKRKYKRTKVELMGRYMLSDRREYLCTLIDVALGGIGMEAPEAGSLGEPVVVYSDRLGRMQGKIVRYVDGGFALQLTQSEAATRKLSDRLERLQRMTRTFDGRERRRDVRVPSADLTPMANLPSGPACEIVNLSILGAEVKVAGQIPPIGALLRLGVLQGRVVRHTEHGVAVRFENVSADGTLADRWDQISTVAGDRANAA